MTNDRDRPPSDTRPPADGRARCAQCGYFLEGLHSPGACPECGRAFDLSDPGSFLVHEPFMRWRFWAPGLVTAVMIACGGLAVGAFSGAWGWSLWLAAPTAGGIMLGYGCRTRIFWYIILALTVATCFIFTMMSLSLGGVFCGMTLSAIILGPIAAGTFVGVLIRWGFKGSKTFGQRWYLPSLLSGLLCLSFALDRPRGLGAVETVVTERVINATAQRAFDELVFFEEVKAPPPWILRVGLARPLKAVGLASAPGDVKACIYNKGQIVKRVTSITPGRELSFDVIDQRIGYEHDVRLKGGSFGFEAMEPRRCRVTLTTTYHPKLSPRWCWRWSERIGVHALHNHVIDAIEAEATRDLVAAQEGAE